MASLQGPFKFPRPAVVEDDGSMVCCIRNAANRQVLRAAGRVGRHVNLVDDVCRARVRGGIDNGQAGFASSPHSTDCVVDPYLSARHT
jgi:hypothetical protein